jgi:RNA polymerase-binding transcription factor DksA
MAKKTVKKNNKAKSAKKAAPKKSVSRKPVAKKVASKKPIAKKVAPKKVASKKPLTKKVAPKKVASKKPVAKKIAPKKVESKKPIAKKVEKPVAKKVEAKKPIAKEAPKALESRPTPPRRPAPKPIAKVTGPVKLGIIPDYVPEEPAISKKDVMRPAKGNQKEDTRNRYSEKELVEFKAIILEKLDQARKDYELLKNTLCHTDDHGTDDTSPTFKMLEDGSEVLTREETAQLALRQEKFIQNLQNALIRIENKTYGICRVSGKLIPKERLRRVPHATLSIDAKLEQQYNA